MLCIVISRVCLRKATQERVLSLHEKVLYYASRSLSENNDVFCTTDIMSSIITILLSLCIVSHETIALQWLANWVAVVLLPLLCIVTAQLPQQYTWVFIEEYQAVVSCVMWGLTSLLLPPGSTRESHLRTTGQAVEVTLADRVHNFQYA